MVRQEIEKDPKRTKIKIPDVARHFGHSVEVADEAYDKGRMSATREAAEGYYAALSSALAKAKEAMEDFGGQAN